MSATDIRLVTAIVSHSQLVSFAPPIVDPSLGYQYTVDQRNFGTLSSNNPNDQAEISGLLYVPTLDASSDDSCAQAYASIPENAVTLSTLPSVQNYPLVAVIPWTDSSACTESYILQARMDAARGAIVFQPGTGDTLSPSLSWRLSGDRGNYVVRWNPYPIYAVSAGVGQTMLQQIALYSGNMSETPNGAQLEQHYDPLDFPRLLVQIRLQSGGRIPIMWVTIIITLGVLLAVCFISAVGAHFLRRHHRRVLRRRLERGEIDLQALGIKKLNVPQDKINEMPRYVYIDSKRAHVLEPTDKLTLGKGQVASFSQSTCPVCLDDFEANITEVRELPCKHIFHPECIDVFLRDRSSLCPLCKESALPKGYCPEITDIMVRRERLARRLRANQQRHENDANAGSAAPTSSGDVELAQSRSNASNAATAAPNVINPTAATGPIPDAVASQGHEARAAWRIERLARQQEEQYNREAEVTRQADIGRPLWRRVMGRVLPGTD